MTECVIGAMPAAIGSDLQVIQCGDEVLLHAKDRMYFSMSANEARQLAAWLVKGAAKIEWEAETWKAHLAKEGMR